MLDEILRVEGLSKQFIKKNMFGSKTSIVKAVEDVSFSLHNDEVLVIAGESGSGKSTIAKFNSWGNNTRLWQNNFSGERDQK